MEIQPREGIRPISDFRKDASRILKRLRESRQPVLLTQRGRSVAVLLDIDTFERMEYDSYLRRSYAKGLEELDAGASIRHEDVIRDMRKATRT